MARSNRYGEVTDDGVPLLVVCHIRGLGLHSVDDYQGWCADNGFSRRLNKTDRELLKERAFHLRSHAEARLARKRAETRRPDKIVTAILTGDIDHDSITQPALQGLCRAAATFTRWELDRALALFRHVHQVADLFSCDPVVADLGVQPGNSFIAALSSLVRHWPNWIRPVETWHPRSHSPHRQFASLARHLLAEWPVPAFMDRVWFQGMSQIAVEQQRWFTHLGSGRNIRTADLPIPFTKRMAHEFMRAPADLSVEGALRWGQMRTIGASEPLIRAVCATWLGSAFANNEFWLGVLRWFVEHPEREFSRIGPIIDYIDAQRFRVAGAGDGSPPQPNFTMKGRTPRSLERQIDEWHGRLARVRQPDAEWPASGIPAFQFFEGSAENGTLKIWTISELRTTKALFKEGRTMKHCVATYADKCQRGETSIWALELESCDGKLKLMTIEVTNSTGLICQVRGKCNVLPTEKHRAILRRWAETANLRLTQV